VKTEGEFSVALFFENGTYEYIRRWVGAQEAVETAKRCTDSSMLAHSRVCRVIITDGGDFTNFEWISGKGVTYPKHDGNRFIGD